MSNSTFETRVQKIWLGDDGILRTVIKPGAEVNLEDAQEITAARLSLIGDRKRPILVDMRLIKYMTREARQHYASEEAAESVLAIAILVKSPISTIIGNLFINFNKPMIPTKLFLSELEAVTWLQSYIE